MNSALCWVAAGLGSPVEPALMCVLALNGLRVSEAIGADIDHLGLERGHRTLTITRKGGKAVTPHTLRHAFITAALDAGVPLRDVQEAASHADPRTTMRAGARQLGSARDLYRRGLRRGRRPVTREGLLGDSSAWRPRPPGGGQYRNWSQTAASV